MRVLRLTNSADRYGDVPPGLRSHEIAERALAVASGEAVETVIREIWPSAALPDLIDGWLNRYEPDLVYLWVPPYWFAYEIIPGVRRYRHRRGARAVSKAAAGLRLKEPILRRIGQARRWYLFRTAQGRAHLPAEEVLECTEQCIRRIARREDITLVVRGPELAMVAHQGARGRRRVEARRRLVHEGLERLCTLLHVAYVGSEDGLAEFDRGDALMTDGVHRSAAAHLRLGGEEADAMVRAWRVTHAIETPRAATEQA